MKTLTLDKKNCTFKELVKYIESQGYSCAKGNGSSHLIFKAPNKPTLSIPNRELSDGTRRNLVKLIFGDNYYSK